jgi:hypothetical protein
VTQGPESGEYRSLSLEEQRQMNAMYRDLNEWNARALKLAEAREAGECSCGWFSALARDPYCAVHNTGTSPK